METNVEVKMKGNIAGRLGTLGFTRAAADLGSILKMKRNLALAYELYRYVTPEKVALFNEKLKKKTGKNMDNAWSMTYQMLDFTPIANYEKVPPEDVLVKLEEAQAHKCFDSFEVGYIRNVEDPLLFGRIEKCPNRFFIAQWDTDVSIDDLLKANEG